MGLFPGAIFKMLDPKVVLLIFVSGKVVLTGARSREDIYRAFEDIYPVLQQFRKDRDTRPPSPHTAPTQAPTPTNTIAPSPHRHRHRPKFFLDKALLPCHLTLLSTLSPSLSLSLSLSVCLPLSLCVLPTTTTILLDVNNV